jgi:hypothetical protein
MEATWWDNLVEVCKSKSFEPVQGPNGIVYIIGSNSPDYETQDNISKIIPFSQRYEFARGMRPKTKRRVIQFIEEDLKIRNPVVADNSDQVLLVLLPIALTPVLRPLLKVFELQILRLVKGLGDNIVEVRVHAEGDRLSREPVAPPVASEPELPGRECISKDEITDLKIRLGQSKDVNDFLKELEAK